MKVICSHCSREIELRDSKIPPGRFKYKCPGCAKVSIHDSRTPDPIEPPHMRAAWEQLQPMIEEYVNRRLEEFRLELVQAGKLNSGPAAPLEHASPDHASAGKSLICEADARIAQSILDTLSRMGYETELARSAREALQKIEHNIYAVITINSSFPDDPSGGKAILRKINARKIEQRRETFAVLVSSSVATVGPLGAFVQGANITVNPADLQRLETLILHGQEEFQRLFQ